MLDNLKKYKVILASNSPRRKELLSGLGVDYEIRTLPDVDESYPDTLRGADIPLYIAKEKANAYRNMLHEEHDGAQRAAQPRLRAGGGQGR